MNLIELIFLPAIIFLGIITSYQDIKFGKIKNKWIIFALIYALVAYVFLVFFYNYNGGIRYQYLLEIFTNLFFSIVAGFGLWLLGIWTAGDGKLFIAFSLLIPFSFYSVGYVRWFPSIILLINLFFIAFIIIVLIMIFRLLKGNIKKVSYEFLKDFFKLKQLIKLVLFIFAGSWIIQFILFAIGIKNNYILISIITLIIFMILNIKFKEKIIYFIFIFAVLRLVFDRPIYSLDFVKSFLYMVIIILIFNFILTFISKLGQSVFSKEIVVKNLRRGMILSEIVVKKEKLNKKMIEEIKKSNLDYAIFKGEYYVKEPRVLFGFNNFIKEEAEGLTDEQINLIKKIGFKKIKVSQTIPFAPLLFLGVLISLISRGDFILFLRSLF